MKIPIYHNKPIPNLATLSEILETPHNILQFLASNADAYYRANKPEVKPNGGIRQTYSVKPLLRNIQELIKDRLFYEVEYPNYLQGSIKDYDDPRSYITNAALHAGHYIVISEDIADFFPSIKKSIVLKMWKYFFGFPPSIAKILTQLTTYRGFLPQGAVTSSYVANLVFWDIEPQLEYEFRNEGYIYSRYVDDIVISANRRLNKVEIEKITSKVYQMLFSANVKPNRSKRSVRTNGSRMTVHKLNVNSSNPTLPQKERQRIRAAVKQCEILAATSRSSGDYRKLFEKTYGRVARMCDLHPQKGKKYKERLNVIRPV